MSFLLKNRANDTKKGGITIEVSLAIGLAVIVLLVVLGLFGDNLQNMIAAGNMNRMFNNNQTKTDGWGSWGGHAGVLEENKPMGEGAQITAKQNAIDNIERLKAKPNPPGLSNTEKVDLAKWLTSYQLANNDSVTPYETDGIIITGKPNYRTIIEGVKTVFWAEGMTSNSEDNATIVLNNSQWNYQE